MVKIFVARFPDFERPPKADRPLAEKLMKREEVNTAYSLTSVKLFAGQTRDVFRNSEIRPVSEIWKLQ